MNRKTRKSAFLASAVFMIGLAGILAFQELPKTMMMDYTPNSPFNLSAQQIAGN